MSRTVAVVLILLFSVPVSAQTVEERLARLEQEVRDLRAENAELRKLLVPTPPPAPAPPPVESGASEKRLILGGLLQTQAETGGELDSRFQNDTTRVYLRRARLSATGAFANDFDFRVEVDAAGSLSNAVGLRAQLTDAYVNWTKYPAARVRIGQFKSPYGFEQLVSDPVLITPERSLANDRLTQGRQLGVMLWGDLPRRVNYSIGAFNGTGVNTNVNDDEGFLVAGRVGATFLQSDALRFAAAVNGYRSEDLAVVQGPDFGFARDQFRGERHAWGADAQLTLGRADFGAEYLAASFDPTDNIPFDEFDASGYYANAAWYFIPKKLQGLIRYESFDPTDGGPGDDRTGTWAVGTNYYIRGNDLKLQLYYYRSDRDEDRVIARFQTTF